MTNQVDSIPETYQIANLDFVKTGRETENLDGVYNCLVRGLGKWRSSRRCTQ